MNFLLPSALLALAALLLPILIHLSRRSEPQRTEFAALRWLQARFRPRSQPVVQEWLLLLVRLLLLSSIVFFLARPVFQQTPAASQWWLLTPGLDATLLPKVSEDDAIERRWLAPGFPEITQEKRANSTGASTFSLLRELDTTLPSNARIRVWVPEQLHGLDAQRLQLSRAIDWQIVKNSAPINSVPRVSEASLPQWQTSADNAQDARVAYFRAAYRYWQGEAVTSNALPHVNTDTPPAHGMSWLRISDKSLSNATLDWVRAGGQVVLMSGIALPPGEAQVLWRDETGAAILQAQGYGQGRFLQFQQALNAQTMPILERAAFAERLRAHLETLPTPQRAMAESIRPSAGNFVWPSAPQSLMSWLLWLILGLFAIERFLATRPSRQVQL